MTIKKLGGIFGRNPTFNEVEAVDGNFSGNLTVDTNTLFVDASNDRVGVGTVSPAEPLHVIGTVRSSTSSTGDFNFYATSDGGGAYRIYPDDATTANPTWLHQSNSSEAQAWVIGGVERLRLDGDGLKFNGDTAAANALDDYEEGSWTPNVEGTTTAGAGTYNTRAGKYTKVGNRVMFNCWINMASHTGSGNMVITGLPYTSASGNNFHNCNVQYSSALTVPSGKFAVGVIFSGSSEIALYSVPTGTTTVTALALDTGFVLNVSGQYEAA